MPIDRYRPLVTNFVREQFYECISHMSLIWRRDDEKVTEIV